MTDNYKLPPQQRIPDKGQYTAIKTIDGGIYWCEMMYQHLHIQNTLGIPTHMIKSGGYLKDGVYDPTYRSAMEKRGILARKEVKR